MGKEIRVGARYTSHCEVTAENSARTLASGTLDVFATPAMIALMENAAMNAVAPFVEEGYETVGTEIVISHTRATPIGAKVTATAKLVEMDGKKLTFNVVANDSIGEIGNGTHMRVIVNIEKFIGKLAPVDAV